jgi:hypothetical protein
MKNALVDADLLNDRLIPFYDKYDIPLLHILTDCGTEYCGSREHHEYQLYLAIEDIDHSKTKAKSPQPNGICEHFHRTIQDEFYAVAFRKKIYESIEELQQDLDLWMDHYNQERTHSGKYCYGKTPMQTWNDSLDLAKEKLLDRQNENFVTLLSQKAEVGSGGGQPTRNNLADRNGEGLREPLVYNHFESSMPKENS